VLILKGLECAKIVQNKSVVCALISKGFGAEALENEQRGRARNCERGVPGRWPSWSVEFKDYGSTIVILSQG